MSSFWFSEGYTKQPLRIIPLLHVKFDQSSKWTNRFVSVRNEIILRSNPSRRVNTNFSATFRLAKPRLPVFVAEENWFGQPKYGAKIYIYSTLYCLLLKKIAFCVFDFVYYYHFEEQMHLFYLYAVSHTYEKNKLRSWKNEENLKNSTFSMFIDSYNLQMAIFLFYEFLLSLSRFLIPIFMQVLTNQATRMAMLVIWLAEIKILLANQIFPALILDI